MAINFPTSFAELGANIHNNLRNNVANYNPGALVRRGIDATPLGAVGPAASSIMNFYTGLLNGSSAPHLAIAAAMHPAVAAAMNVPAGGVPVTQLTDKSMAQYGALSPAARAVLGNVDPNGVVKNAPAAPDQDAVALQGVPTFSQLMAGYAAGNGGKISLRAISALADAAQKGAAAGSATRKAPGIADIAGAQALQLGNQYFESQKSDAAKAGDKHGYSDANRLHVEFLKELSRGKSYDPLSGSAYGQQP